MKTRSYLLGLILTLLAGCDAGSSTEVMRQDASVPPPLEDASLGDGDITDSTPPEMDASTIDGGVDVEERIRAAGNAEEETERFEILSQLRRDLPSDHPLNADLDLLLPIIDQWTNGRERFWMPGDQEMAGEGGYLAAFFNLQVWPGAETFPPPLSGQSPLRPIWAFYRARMLIWTAIENGLLAEQSFTEGRLLLSEARAAFPSNPIIGMYLEDPIPWEVPFDPDPAAPDWANLQRTALFKLNEVINFWITERQAPDGQFGGGWGDDVELWRWWTPILLGFESTSVTSAHRLLANNMFELPRLAGGYTAQLMDVEHSSEDTGDTITSMLLLEPESEVWRERAGRVLELADTLWFGLNEQEPARYQFRSTYFSSMEVDESPEHNCDTPYHTRALQPPLLLWQLTGDELNTERLRDWLMNWVDASAREESGKPAGLPPAAISFPSGLVRNTGSRWWQPGCHHTFTTFSWPRGLSLLSQALVLAHVQTGEAAFLTPIRAMAGVRDQGDASAEEGSLPWAAETLGNKAVDAMAKYRLATENAQFDNILRSAGDAYVRSQLSGQTQPLEEGLRALLNALRFDRAAHTSEVRFTDRVFKFHRRYADAYRAAPNGGISFDLLYEMVTGDFGGAGYLPLSAVRWQTEPDGLAVRVTRNETRRFAAELYNFEMSARRLSARLLRLEEGRYRWTLTGLGGILDQDTFEVRDGRALWSGRLPARELCTLQVEPHQ